MAIKNDYLCINLSLDDVRLKVFVLLMPLFSSTCSKHISKTIPKIMHYIRQIRSHGKDIKVKQFCFELVSVKRPL